jgi:hypothetical protein
LNKLVLHYAYPYYETTLRLEGRNGVNGAKNGDPLLCRWVGTITRIMKKTGDSGAHFEGLRMSNADCIYFYSLSSSSYAFEEIAKYWNIVHRTPDYYASMILDLRQRKKWFRKHWTRDTEFL